MKKTIFSSFIILSILISALWLVAPASADSSIIYVRPDGDDTNCNGTADVAYPGSGTNLNCAKKTIQAGINAVGAGGTVYVAAGTYNENVAITKGVDLRGANYNIDPNTGSRVAETVLDGTFSLQSSGISVNGFKVIGAGAAFAGGGSGPWSNVSITHNLISGKTGQQVILYGFNFPTTTEGGTEWTISNNRIEDIQQNDATAIAIFNITGLTVSNNTILHSNSAFNGRRGMNLDGCQNVTVSNNTVNMGLVNPASDNSDNAFTKARYSLQLSASDRSVNNVTVTGNTFGGAYDGMITLGNGNFDTINITNNTITNNVLGIRFQAGSNGPAGSQSNITITNNTINTSNRCIYLQDGSVGGGTPDQYSNVSINQNKLLRSTSGVALDVHANAILSGGGPVDATGNWWGTLSWSGYQTVSGIQSRVAGNVDWQPWSNATFTADFEIPTITYADDNNVGKTEGQAGANGGTFGYDAFATIQEALNHVASGGSTYVGAGNYSSDIQINKAVTVIGQNQPVLDGRFWIKANNVTVQGFEIQNGRASTGVDQSGIYIEGAQNVVIRDNHLIGTWTGGANNFAGGRGILTSGNVNNLLVEHNLIEKWVSGLYLNPTSGAIVVRNNDIKNNWAGAGTDGQKNVQFRNNNFIGNLEGIGASNVGDAFIVEQNAFSGNTDAVKWYTPGKPIEAKLNWWSGNKGPTATSNPKGNGQPVSSNVTYAPWLCDGTDTQPNQRGFQPGANAARCTNLATKLVFTQYPSSAFENIPFAQQPVVRAEDEDGNLAITFDNFVFLDIANNPVGGMLLPGPYYKKAVDGVATFSGLYINKAGQGYTLKAFGLDSSGKDFILTEGDMFDVLKQQADLGITLADSPDPVNVGEALSYAITVSNGGPHVAQGVSVVLQLPAGVAFQSASGTGWSCTQSGGVVTCTRASLGSGQTAPGITVQVTAPAQAGTITASASVALADSMVDPVEDNNQASATTTVVELPPTGPSFILYLPLVLNNTP